MNTVTTANVTAINNVLSTARALTSGRDSYAFSALDLALDTYEEILCCLSTEPFTKANAAWELEARAKVIALLPKAVAPHKMVRRGCANLVSVSVLIISLCVTAIIGAAIGGINETLSTKINIVRPAYSHASSMYESETDECADYNVMHCSEEMLQVLRTQN